MKYGFVIDENVVISATTERNPEGHKDLASKTLVLEIIEGCHQIAWSNSVYARWSRQSQRLVAGRVAIDPTFMNLFFQAQIMEGKLVHVVPDPPVLPDESDWSSKLMDDCDFIRLAAHVDVGAVLSTLDQPLINDILRLKLDQTYAFEAILPPPAIRLAKQPCV